METVAAIVKGTLGTWVGERIFGSGRQFNSSTDIPDLKGKIAIVTGGNNGLGLESVLKLAKANVHVYLAARTPSKAETAISSIKEAVPNARITYLELDLASLASVKKAADTFTQSSDRLDILMNNAGVMALPAGLTADGYEIQFGTNHVGHYLFTKLLMPTLVETAESGGDVSIVNVSSDGYKFAPSGGLVFDEVKTDMESYSTWARYGQSKLANILFTKSLASRHPNIRSVVTHPGPVDTGLSLGFQQSHPWLTVWAKPMVGWALKTPEQGALTQLFAATSEDAKSGSYYTPTAIETKLSAPAENTELAERLWQWTEEELKGLGY